MIRWTIVLAGVLGASAVALGAFAAHGLEGWLERQSIDSLTIEKRMEQCEVAVRYHIIHSLALLSVGLSGFSAKRFSQIAVFFWILGVCLFAGGLYCNVFFGTLGHWSIVPIGGLCMILGWMSVGIMGLLYHTDREK